MKLGKDDALKAAEVGTIKITDPKTKKGKNVTLSTDQIETIKKFIEESDSEQTKEKKSLFQRFKDLF